MASYYGTIQGHRGVVSRCGSGKSGVRAMVKSWSNTAEMCLGAGQDEKDELVISIPKGLKTIINGKEYKF